MPERTATATPEQQLDELRERQRADRKKLNRIEQRIKDRAKKIEETRAEAKLVERLKGANLLRPSLVVTEADRASDANDIPEAEFRAMALVVLKKETGIPQRNIFGCDHGGSMGDRPPYCNQEVTRARGQAFLQALHSDVWEYMNGVHWTQTTWYEKVFRVERLSDDLTNPAAHLRVCLGDLAILRDAFGVAEAFRRYNGSGPAAEAYKAAAMALMPWATNLVKGG